jgi:hypothetical protein
MAGTTKKGRYSSKKNPCPLCGNTTGSCKHNHDGSIYCYYTEPLSAPSGYVHIRELSGGMGQEFIEPHVVEELLRAGNLLQSRGNKASAREMSDLTGLPSSWAMAVQKAYPSRFPEWNGNSFYHNSKAGNKQTPVENLPPASEDGILGEAERDKQYRQILNQLQLSAAHRAHLQEVRVLTEFIDFIGFRSWQEIQVKNVSANLPGVVERDGSLYLWGKTGVFLPMYNELSQIIAFQVLADEKETGKYKWGSSAPSGGSSPRLDNGEMPLAFWRPQSVQISSIGLVEGVLKASSVACNLQQIIIGAPGATWDCSPQLLRRYLEKATEEKNIELSDLVLDLYVDAGMLANKHIMHRYYETIKLLQKWGCKVRVGWWGQFSKESPDIDDLIIQGNRHQITYISIDE